MDGMRCGLDTHTWIRRWQTCVGISTGRRREREGAPAKAGTGPAAGLPGRGLTDSHAQGSPERDWRRLGGHAADCHLRGRGGTAQAAASMLLRSHLLGGAASSLGLKGMQANEVSAA